METTAFVLEVDLGWSSAQGGPLRRATQNGRPEKTGENLMNRTTRRAAALGSAVALVLAVAGCSTDATPVTSTSARSTVTSSTASATSTPTTTEDPAPKAAELLSEVKSNALAAKSAAFEGQVDQGGKTLHIAFKGTADGKTSDIGVDRTGLGTLHVIVVGADVYVQADAKFWKAQGAPDSVQKAADKYVKTSRTKGGFTDITLKSFMDQAFGALSAGGLDGRVGSETVDGIDCWVLTDKSGKQNGALYVAKDTKQLVRFEGTKANPGELTFSQWNADLKITAPAADQVIKLG